MVRLKSPKQIEKMKDAGKIVAAVFVAMKDAVRPGISTWDLDQIAYRIITEHGAEPLF